MDIHDLVDELGIWWPKADRGRLRQAIAAYRQMAADCGAVRDRCAATVGHVHASNSGPPFQAFDEYWARWQGGSQSYLDAIPQFCSEMADALERYLEAVEDAIHKLEELAVIALTAIGVGIALTVFTAGLSDAAAAGATAALVSAAGVEAGTMAAVICEIAATAFVTAAFGFVDGLVIDTAVQVERIEVFGDQKSWSWGELWQSGGMGALGGGAAGGFTRGLTSFGGAGVRGLLAGSRGARMAFGAGVGTGSAALVDVTFTGRVNPLDLLIGGVGGAAGGAATGWRGGRGATAIDPTERGAGTGLRRSRFNKLSPDEIQQLRSDFQSIGGDPSMLRFNKGSKTGYVDQVDLIYVKGDVMPSADPTATEPNATMSPRAALAHELGHRQFRGTALDVGDPSDEIRASLWAAKNMTRLSNQERMDLLLDALGRARSAGDWNAVEQIGAMMLKPIIKWQGYPLDLPWWEA